MSLFNNLPDPRKSSNNKIRLCLCYPRPQSLSMASMIAIVCLGVHSVRVFLFQRQNFGDKLLHGQIWSSLSKAGGLYSKLLP